MHSQAKTKHFPRFIWSLIDFLSLLTNAFRNYCSHRGTSAPCAMRKNSKGAYMPT